jgi:hypothetical protein
MKNIESQRNHQGRGNQQENVDDAQCNEKSGASVGVLGMRKGEMEGKSGGGSEA